MVKNIPVLSKKDCVVLYVPSSKLGFTPAKIWCPSPSETHRTQPYPIPHKIMMGNRFTPEAGARFAPPPFAAAVAGKNKKALLVLRARKGWHLWNFVEFRGDSSGVEILVDFEGHTNPAEAAKNISLKVFRGGSEETLLQLLTRGMQQVYPLAFNHGRRESPRWWLRPIYCGWGDQAAAALAMEGPGAECRGMAYCIQGLYERWIRRLEETGVPVGTVIIDSGWSPAGTLEPNKIQWPDLRGFIRRQHDRDRRVLLWLGTFLHEGLPDRWCVYAGKTKLVADASNREYRKYLRQQVFRLLSSEKGCFDADGFKIDQLMFVPSERHLRGCEHFGRSFVSTQKDVKLKTAGKKWGCELVYQLQKDIYLAAKGAKQDALITSSTVHPYFYDTFDMVRLHDTGVLTKDVFTAMKARADLSRAVLPHLPVDTDNWIAGNYRKWLDYTLTSYRLGVPCIFYSERFVLSFGKKPATCEIPEGDLRRIGRLWRREKNKNNTVPWS